MKILICSDGTAASDNAIRMAALLGPATRVPPTLLGIAETPADEQPLREALDKQVVVLRDARSAVPRLIVRSGEPITQILAETSVNKYDLVVIGARRKQTEGYFWQSQRTYEIIKSIEPSVLVALGNCARLSRFLVCTGGKRYIDDAVRLTGTLAAAVGAQVTLLNVMAEPPAIYADLVEMEEDVDALLASGSELGRNLQVQKQALQKLGVTASIRVRHDIVTDEIFDEVTTGGYDLIVSGSSRARGPLRHYIMGDITRSIVNRAECSVLVARSSRSVATGDFWHTLREKLFPAAQQVR
jgi:nucleotide-binding universal stress UspA family protein